MNRYAFFVLALVVVGIIIYVTFVIALIKITLGLILLAIAAVLLWLLWRKVKKKAEETF